MGRRYGTNSSALLAAVQNLAGPVSGLSVVDKASRVVNIFKVRRCTLWGEGRAHRTHAHARLLAGMAPPADHKGTRHVRCLAARRHASELPCVSRASRAGRW